MSHVRLSLVLALVLAACGGSTPTRARTTVRTARPVTLASVETAPEPVREERDEPAFAMQTFGLTGSLSTIAVQDAIAPHLEELGACFMRHGRRLRTLGGRIALAFHIRADGTVGTVHASDSTIGHRAVERCILDVARAIRFPRPQGGEADASYPLEMDPPEHVRGPVTWDPSEVAWVVRHRGRDVLEECRPDDSDATFQVTAYVASSGRVIAAGATAPDEALDEPLDCVAREVRRWHMPRHRRGQAKVTFEIR